jgi:hypothetical protein
VSSHLFFLLLSLNSLRLLEVFDILVDLTCVLVILLLIKLLVLKLCLDLQVKILLGLKFFHLEIPSLNLLQQGKLIVPFLLDLFN